MCETGQSLPIDRGKGEMSARCCGSSAGADPSECSTRANDVVLGDEDCRHSMKKSRNMYLNTVSIL